jgi:hypothetical protein
MLRIFALFAVVLVCATAAPARVYELRTYHCYPGRLEALKARFRNHTIQIFSRHGMESIGYWVPEDPEKAKSTLVYIISHASREQADTNWKEFRADPEWMKVQAESEKDGKIVEKVDREFLDPTDFSKLK